MRILLVEDDPQFANLIQTQLRRMPSLEARLESARTLAEAVEKLRAERFGLVVTDLNLPDSSGLQTVEALSRAGEQLVIVLTGDQNPALRAGALECGAYDFLSKDNLSAAALERLVRLASIQAQTFGSLRESEARLRYLIQLSTDFFWETDPQHRVVKVEHGVERHPAVNPAQVGKARWDLPSTRPAAEGWAAHRATMEAHLPFREFEVARIDADGVERHRSLSGEPVFDARGAFRGYRGVGRDITAQKRAEEALHRFRLALDTSPDMILLIDRASMRHVDVNTTACRLLGYAREELLALGPQDILPLARAELERLYDLLIADPSAVTGMRSHYRCKDGSLLPFESTRRVLRSAGRWIIAVISRDIRERIAAENAMRESESRFRSLSALSSDWYWEQDTEFRLTYMSSIEKTGLDASAYLGRKRWDQPALNLTEADWARHRAQLERHEPFRDFEIQRPAEDGATAWISLSGEPVFDAGGRFAGYRGIGRDITARKHSEKQVIELERRYAALGEANEAVLRARSPLEAFERACDVAVSAGGFQLVTVFTYDGATGGLTRQAASGAAAALVKQVVPKIDASQLEGGGVLGHASRTGRPAISNDYAIDPRTAGRRDAVAGYRIGSAAAFPLHVGGSVVAVLGVQHAEQNAFTDELTILLQRLSDSICFALENFRRENRRVEAEAALHQSEAWFRQTFELAGSGIAHVGLDGVFLRVNRRLCEILGYADAELIGRSVREISHPEDRDAADPQRERMCAGELESVQLEKRYLRRDGTTVWVDLTVALARDAQRALYEISIIEDITERKAAEAALRESEARFRSLTELSADFYWETDTEHRVLRTTHGSNHRPISTAQVGKKRWELLSTRPDAAGWAAHRAMLEAHLPFRDFELARLDAEGVERHLSISGQPIFDAAGGFLGYRGIGKEITARKHEAALLTLEHEVTRCLAEAASADAGLRAVIAAVCEAHGWPCGRYFTVDAEKGLLRFAEAWGQATPAVESFVARSRETVYARGQGLSGAVWQSGEPLWVRDVSKDPRASGSSRAVLQGGAFVFPVTSGDLTLGVLSFSSADAREPDARLLQAARVIGSQVGQFLQRKQAETRRHEIELQFRRTFELAGTGLAHIGLDRRFIRVNRRLCEIFGHAEHELIGRAAKEFSHPDDVDVINEQRPRLYAGEIDAVRGEKRYVRKDGSIVWLAYTVAVERDAHGQALYEITVYDDVTDRKRAEERQTAHLRYQERVARFGQSALVKSEPAELVEKAVQAMLEALGAEAVAYVEAERGTADLVLRAVVGVADPAASPGPIACAQGDPIRQAMSGSRMLTDGAKLPLAWARDLRSAALIPVRSDNEVRGVLCVCYKQADAFGAQELNFVEATASVLATALQRIDSEARLAYLAQFDPLTGLPNRTLLADRFSQMIVQAKRRDSPLAVLFIDLDEFKMVNDTLGHAGGDALLKEVAVRLQSSVRPGDTVARISGDEFAIVLADMARLDDAALVAQKLIDRLAEAVEVHGKEVFVTASVGIAAYPSDGTDAEALIGAADAAMYRAKQSGRNAYQFYTPEINQRSRARAQLGSELRRALERGEFALVYQPKYQLADRRPSGAEALLRWKHPERGTVSPAEFIPVLEETGLIVPVGEWVIARACEDLKAWQAAGLRICPVSVNLSARQFRLQDLDTRVKAVVAAAGIDPGLIELEITESQLMQDPDHAIRVMRALREAGMRIAIDDFGTGYSSLAYLTRFPVGSLKIDRSFVKDMANNKDDATIVRTIIEMAHSLGYTVVAEGVETEEQANFLRLLRCEQAQGFLFARPMPAQEFARFCAM